MSALRVLLVDDDEDTLEELGECLSGAGLSCVTAEGAPAARRAIDAHEDIGVLVTDLNMPGEDGLSLMRYCNGARAPEKQMKVILITGGASLGSAIQAVREGAFDYITKPAEPKVLIDTVHRACTAVASQRASAERTSALATLERQAEETATDNRRRGEEFLSMMSHELRTPLNPIIGFAQLMRDHADHMSSETLKDYAGDVVTAGQRMLSLVERMLLLAAIRKGTATLKIQACSVADVFAAALGRLARWGVSADRLLWPVPPDTTIIGDTQMLGDALAELIVNAIQFGGEEKPVTIVATMAVGEIGFGVLDHGPGMTPTQIARVLQPFEQLDTGDARVVQGAGLGLALAQRIIVAHGGLLALSARPSGGLRAMLTVPVESITTPY